MFLVLLITTLVPASSALLVDQFPPCFKAADCPNKAKKDDEKLAVVDACVSQYTHCIPEHPKASPDAAAGLCLHPILKSLAKKEAEYEKYWKGIGDWCSPYGLELDRALTESTQCDLKNANVVSAFVKWTGLGKKDPTGLYPVCKPRITKGGGYWDANTGLEVTGNINPGVGKICEVSSTGSNVAAARERCQYTGDGDVELNWWGPAAQTTAYFETCCASMKKYDGREYVASGHTRPLLFPIVQQLELNGGKRYLVLLICGCGPMPAKAKMIDDNIYENENENEHDGGGGDVDAQELFDAGFEKGWSAAFQLKKRKQQHKHHYYYREQDQHQQQRQQQQQHRRHRDHGHGQIHITQQ